MEEEDYLKEGGKGECEWRLFNDGLFGPYTSPSALLRLLWIWEYNNYVIRLDEVSLLETPGKPLVSIYVQHGKRTDEQRRDLVCLGIC